MRKSSSLISLVEPDIEEILNPKVNTTDRICGIINFISLVPTVIYNIAWLFLLKNSFNGTDNQAFLEQIKLSTECSSLFNDLNTAFVWVIISLSKSVFFLLCAKMFCGNENDCNILCLILKAVTSYFPSMYFYFKLDYAVKIPDGYLSQIGNGKCENLLYYTKYYYATERGYFIFFSILLLSIPFGSILMAFKELWKSQGYVVKDQ